MLKMKVIRRLDTPIHMRGNEIFVCKVGEILMITKDKYNDRYVGDYITRKSSKEKEFICTYSTTPSHYLDKRVNVWTERNIRACEFRTLTNTELEHYKDLLETKNTILTIKSKLYV